MTNKYNIELIKQKGKYWCKSGHSRYYFNKTFISKEVLKLTKTKMNGKPIDEKTYNMYNEILSNAKIYYDDYQNNIYIHYNCYGRECYYIEEKLRDFFFYIGGNYDYEKYNVYEECYKPEPTFYDRTYEYFF